MNITQLVGISAGILTAFSLLPQLIKIIKEKKAEDVSLWMLIILMCGLVLWTIYGVMKNDLPIIATNAFSFLLNAFVIILRFKYNR